MSSVVVWGHPGSPRIQSFATASVDFPTISYQLIPWIDLLQDGPIHEIYREPVWVRLESAGRNANFQHRLLEMWHPEVPSFPTAKTSFRLAVQFHSAWAKFLESRTTSWSGNANIHWTAQPMEVLQLFDKYQCGDFMKAHSIPTPATFLMHDISVADFFQQLDSLGWKKAFLKWRFGSSAVGILFLELRHNQWHGWTTLRFHDNDWHNTRRLVAVSGSSLQETISVLLQSGAVLQEYFPKAFLNGQQFDLRLILIAGTIEFIVVRCSPHQITNIHLGGTKGDVGLIRKLIPKRLWLDACDMCEKIGCLYRSLVLGIDLAFDAAISRFTIFEVNAFGDHFPTLRNEQNRSVHQVILQWLATHPPGTRFGESE
ncbi:MAG: STM4014 family protein [Zavarzinella sp.]